MSKRIFDKIPLLLLRFHTSKVLLQPFRYNLKSTYNFQNNVNNKYSVSRLKYYSDPSPDDTVVNFDELQQLLKEKNNGKQKNLYIVDVREPSELNDGHIPHAINISLNRFEEGKSKKKIYLRTITRKHATFLGFILEILYYLFYLFFLKL